MLNLPLVSRAHVCVVIATFMLATIMSFGISAPSWSQRSPLLMEGKTSLYQRVLTRPGTPLVENPGEEADANAEPLPPLTPLYVYNRVDMSGRTWLEVGRANQGPTDGWLNANRTIPWRQAMTLAFTNPAGREQTLFFRDFDPLADLVEGGSPGPTAAGLRARIGTAELPAGYPVISIEPDTHVDLSENFYLLPILDFDEVYFEDGFITQLVNVAAVTATESALPQRPEPAAPPVSGSAPTAPELPLPEVIIPDVDSADVLSQVHNDFSAGIVFVIDTTTSMGPYIDRVRDSVRLMYRQLAGSEYGDRMSFGLIGYRDNLDAAPGLDYLTRVFADLGDAPTEGQFFARIRQAEAATASSRGFEEDAFAGVFSALNEVSWSRVDARWVVLITDAGARSGNDPLSATGLGPAEINVLAEQSGIFLSAIHLLTPSGRNDHGQAALQYQLMSRMSGTGDTLYHGVQAGDPAEFSSFIETLAQSIALQVELAGEGRLVEIREGALEEARTEVERRRAALRREQSSALDAAAAEAARRSLEEAEVQAQYEEELADFQRRVMLAGRAMQLSYLGREAGTQAPSFFEAWAADRDLENPALATFDVRVLLSRNQLSDLTLALRTILDTAERTRMSPRDFFNQLQTASALLSRTPEQVGSVSRLSQIGVVGEYLEDLPYRSRVLEVTEDQWLSWGFDQQREFLDDLRQKIELYEQLNDEVTLWIALDGGRVPGDAVYPVPLANLP